MDQFNRRDFLTKMGAYAISGVATTFIPSSASGHIFAKPLLSSTPPKTISLYNTHTSEWLNKVTFYDNESFRQEALKALNHFFRDHRTGDIYPIDPNLFNVLHRLSEAFDHKTLHLVSGYRSQHSNNALCTPGSGVARRSLHLDGKAADIFIENVTQHRLEKAAHTLQAGGVGRYSGFVHVDTGRVRRW
jgi:uncharacterized protein YcbK (DUF882 family)